MSWNRAKKDFSVYRSIGISEQEVSFMILFEQLIIAVVAAVIVVSLHNFKWSCAIYL